MNGNRITLAILFQGDHRLTLALFRSLSLGQKSGFSSICVLVLAGQLPVGFIHRLPGIFVILADFTIMFICVRIWMGVVCILLRSVFFFYSAANALFISCLCARLLIECEPWFTPRHQWWQLYSVKGDWARGCRDVIMFTVSYCWAAVKLVLSWL